MPIGRLETPVVPPIGSVITLNEKFYVIDSINFTPQEGKHGWFSFVEVNKWIMGAIFLKETK